MTLQDRILQHFSAQGFECNVAARPLVVVNANAPRTQLALQQDRNELTLVLTKNALLEVATQLRDTPEFCFEQLIDVCGVDYLTYGVDEWVTDKATGSGFERAVNRQGLRVEAFSGPRFAVVYHLLSVKLNQRLRLKVFLDEVDLRLPSVISIWRAADWFEREAFDLFGFLFEGHPDLRRILTDYGFIGHPFRKDFPTSGHVEMRYDKATERVIYQPVSIPERVLVPKVIREDSRYLEGEHPHD
ncbi:MAG: NADH-quinone oxidoreductase subunit C [Gammaproteobacteria bacterium]|nr:NADH-quinone oxidoreductase subunit C [Gammaproteobacteria bacterium]